MKMEFLPKQAPEGRNLFGGLKAEQQTSKRPDNIE
jgi:hypothetical protein